MFKVSIFKANRAIGKFHEHYEADSMAEILAHVAFLNRTANFWGTGNTYAYYEQSGPLTANLYDLFLSEPLNL